MELKTKNKQKNFLHPSILQANFKSPILKQDNWAGGGNSVPGSLDETDYLDSFLSGFQFGFRTKTTLFVLADSIYQELVRRR